MLPASDRALRLISAPPWSTASVVICRAVGDEWSEQVALEHLAVLSAVARWADETEVIPGSKTPRQP
jgi:hypothetical protein